MKARIRALAVRLREKALGPVLFKLDQMSESIEQLGKRVTELEIVVQSMDGRAASAVERSVRQDESQARLARRVEEIEKLLSGPDEGPNTTGS